MRLKDVVAELSTLDQEATIYVERPWSPSSRAVVAREPADGSVPRAAAGLEYFLEVHIALEASRTGDIGSSVERVLHYAVNDAFLFGN